MRYGDRSDADLMASAQAGWSPAFAVLLHRHGPAVRSAVRDEADPITATRDVFLTAIDELPQMDPQFPVREWLLDIAGTDQVPDPIIPLREDERDAIWASLVEAWPGRPRAPRTALRRTVLVVGLVLLSALVPTLVFLADEAPPREVQELSAHPVVDENAEQTVPDEDATPTPTFSFPSVPDEEPQSSGQTDPLPTTIDPDPQATVEPEPEPTTTAAPDPPPTTTPTPEPTATTEPEPEPTETTPVEPPVTEQPPVDPDPGEPDLGTP
ncbi:hypothetical protein [Egicoccus sp. AB-alg6-2]|uniref:hypothetical protein n=1 Tax=Egicoccus sp. AB-alg6-2 TaxID=3242692 RepID=UPI00359E2E04